MLCTICQSCPAISFGTLCEGCSRRRTVLPPADAATVRAASSHAYREQRRMERGQTNRIRSPDEIREAEYRAAENDAERRSEQAAEAIHCGDRVVGWNGRRAVYRSDRRA